MIQKGTSEEIIFILYLMTVIPGLVQQLPVATITMIFTARKSG